jgi:RNA-binding protein 23/39
LNGFELAGRAIRVGLGNDKFTNESTQAILDRYNGFQGDMAELDSRNEHSAPHGGGNGRVANLDDTDVAGVSFQNVSREALMRKLAREEPKEEAAPYDLE